MSIVSGSERVGDQEPAGAGGGAGPFAFGAGDAGEGVAGMVGGGQC